MRIVVTVGDNAQVRRGEPPDGMTVPSGSRRRSTAASTPRPRTQDLTVELPDLVAAIAHRFGPVDRISLGPEAWNSRPCTITIGERVVLLDWFGARQRHTVGLFGPHSSRFDLLVILPDTAMIVALACLTVQIPTESSPEREQRNRWEDDGGRTGCAVPRLPGGEV